MQQGQRIQCFNCSKQMTTFKVVNEMISGEYKFCKQCGPGRPMCSSACVDSDHSGHNTRRLPYTWTTLRQSYITWCDNNPPAKRQRLVDSATVMAYDNWPHVRTTGEGAAVEGGVGDVGAGVSGVGVAVEGGVGVGGVGAGVSGAGVAVEGDGVGAVMYPSKPLTLLEKEAVLCSVFEYLGVDPSDVGRVNEALDGLLNAPALTRPADMAGSNAELRCISCRTNITILCYRLEKDGQLMVNDGTPKVACLACGERVQLDDTGVGEITERQMDVKSGVVPPVTHTVKLTKCRVVTDHEALYMCQLLREAREIAIKPFTPVVLGWGVDRPQITGGYTVPVGDQQLMIINRAQTIELMQQLNKKDFMDQGVKSVGNWGSMFKQIFVDGIVYAKPTINKSTALHELIIRIRAGEWGLDTTDGLLVDHINVFDSTLGLLGTVGNFTWFHCDRDPAQNFAVGVTTKAVVVDENTVLAMWVLIHPDKAVVADLWLREHVAADGFHHDSFSIKPTPTKETMLQLRDHLGMDECGRYYVVILEQRPGDMISVPAGWIHCVINMAPNFKLAWDYMKPAELPVYTRVWREILTRITTNGEDYGGTMVALPDMLRRIQITEVRKLLPMYR